MLLEKYKDVYLNISSILLIVLLSYAAVVKGYDLNLFQKQMTESPLIPLILTDIISYVIPSFELLAVLLLFFQSTRFWGFILSYFLMLFFSVYLIALLYLFGSNLPCACGGILGEMGYKTHIIFNIFFTILAFISTIITSYDNKIILFAKQLDLSYSTN